MAALTAEVAPRGGSPEPPSVLIVGNFLSARGGSRGVCEDLSARLRAAGWTVHTTSHRKGRIPRLFSMLSTIWTLRREYAVAQVDVYSGPAFLWAAAAVELLARLRKPVVLTLHGGSLPAFTRRHPGRVERLLAKAAVVTAPSEYLARGLAEQRRNILRLPNPLEVAAYPFVPRSQPRERLVWLRAFHEIYDPSLAVEVLARLVTTLPAVSLTMIGPDKHDGSLERVRAAALRLGVADRLRVIPGVPKSRVGEHLSEGDVFLNTTTIDNSPVSVAEAMACGLCVVSTDAGGLRDLIEDGKDGILVPPRDAEAMASAVLRVLREPGFAASLSSGARRKAEFLDWSLVLPKWERLLRETAETALEPS